MIMKILCRLLTRAIAPFGDDPRVGAGERPREGATTRHLAGAVRMTAECAAHVDRKRVNKASLAFTWLLMPTCSPAD
jgi:hypothetical protein